MREHGDEGEDTAGDWDENSQIIAVYSLWKEKELKNKRN